MTAGGKTQTRIYGTDGALLVRSGPVAGTTAFMGDTEVTVSPAGQLSASRTFGAAGGVFACRTTAPGGSSRVLTWLAADPQNTATVAVDGASGAATVRYFDPFGADRDAAAAPSWPNRDGFLNAPADPFTGTTRLGARDYSPTLGRFLTVDPLLDTGDPQQIDGYAYALNNPITNADPSGLCVHAFTAPEVVRDPLYGRTALHLGRLFHVAFGAIGLGVTWREDHGG